VGTANTTGASPYAARADHRHAERQATLDRIATLETLLADPLVTLAYAPDLLVDHTTGRSFAVSATGPVVVAMRDSAPADGATVQLEVCAEGAASSVTFAPPTTMLAGLTTPFVVADGAIGVFALRYSARTDRWTLTSAGVEQ
jgi:hypothetical protein